MFFAGKYNGYGGKQEKDEDITTCARRELLEESGIIAEDMVQTGYIVFDMVESNKLMRVFVFVCTKYQSEPIETDEMTPFWFNENELPFDLMWPDDKHWLPIMLKESLLGKKLSARFEYEDDDTITDFTVNLM